MARLKLYLDQRSKMKDGTCHVKISISHNGTSSLYPTDIFVKPNQWNPGNEDTTPQVRKTDLGHRQKNTLLESVFERVNTELMHLYSENTLMTFKNATQVKNHIQNKIAGKGQVSFTEYFAEFYTKKDLKPKTKMLYRLTYDKVMAFSRGKEVRFQDVTRKWLTDFESSMSNLAINTRGIYLRNVRAVINSAIDNEVTDIPYPFRKFSIKTQETIKRSMTIEDIRKLRDFECEPHQRIYVDIFMLIFYLQGINLIDLCNLKEVYNGRIEFLRAKTGRKYSIKVEPEAMRIINKYRGKKYLLNILDRYKDHSDFIKRMNRNLRQIGPTKIGKYNVKERQPLFPMISSYWARHSWATIAANDLDIPKETIAAGLGHGTKSVTDIYINFDMRKVDEANRRMITHSKTKIRLRDLTQKYDTVQKIV